MAWFVYIVEAENGKLYTGIAVNPRARFKQHRSGRGAKFFRSSKAKTLVFQEQCKNKSEALQREAAIKRMSRKDKLFLIGDTMSKPIDFKFKKGASVSSDDLYYDLFENYIDPEKLLEDPKQIKEVQNAIKIIESFLNQAEEKGVLEVR